MEPPRPGSCALGSACSSRSVGSGVKEKQSDLSTSSICYRGRENKRKSVLWTRRHCHRAQGTKMPSGSHSRQGCRVALGCAAQLLCALTRAKTDRSWVACLPRKVVTVCILTHSSRHCGRQNGQQHLGLRTLRARINFHFRGSYMECKMVPPLGSLTI